MWANIHWPPDKIACYTMAMKWAKPPLNKVYEALGAIGDKRIELNGNSAKVYSSSRNKYYDVVYNPITHSITSNDNASYYVGYLGYPSIAYLLASSMIDYDPILAEYLTGFAWKDINQKFKNNFAKTDAYIDEEVAKKHNVDLDDFHSSLEGILDKVMALDLNKVKSTLKPPKGY